MISELKKQDNQAVSRPPTNRRRTHFGTFSGYLVPKDALVPFRSDMAKEPICDRPG